RGGPGQTVTLGYQLRHPLGRDDLGVASPDTVVEDAGTRLPARDHLPLAGLTRQEGRWNERSAGHAPIIAARPLPGLDICRYRNMLCPWYPRQMRRCP